MFKAVNTAAVIALSLLTACTTINPYTREEQTSNAAKGATIGAAAGALVGLLTKGDKGDNALIGAAIGGLAGAGVGVYMDTQEAKLRQQLEDSGVSVTRNGEQLTLNMPAGITFATGSADLNSAAFQALDSVALVLKEYSSTTIVIAGHTDSRGRPDSNQLLSERRAHTVATYLQSRGVEPARVTITGYGQNRPVAPNDTEFNRAQNRRVEIVINPVVAES